jgi:hypothetical protein
MLHGFLSDTVSQQIRGNFFAVSVQQLTVLEAPVNDHLPYCFGPVAMQHIMVGAQGNSPGSFKVLACHDTPYRHPVMNKYF